MNRTLMLTTTVEEHNYEKATKILHFARSLLNELVTDINGPYPSLFASCDEFEPEASESIVWAIERLEGLENSVLPHHLQQLHSALDDIKKAVNYTYFL